MVDAVDPKLVDDVRARTYASILDTHKMFLANYSQRDPLHSERYGLLERKKGALDVCVCVCACMSAC